MTAYQGDILPSHVRNGLAGRDEVVERVPVRSFRRRVRRLIWSRIVTHTTTQSREMVFSVDEPRAPVCHAPRNFEQLTAIVDGLEQCSTGPTAS